MTSAWEGLRADRVWDMHVHLAGIGDARSGIETHESMHHFGNPIEFGRKHFFTNAACAAATRAQPSVDLAYLSRLRALVEMMPPGVKAMVFAFERTHREDGTADPAHTTLHVPNDWAQRFAGEFPSRFEWVASIHPYRPDAIDALAAARAGGARAIKWLPSAMAIDPASPRCDRFYRSLADADLPLISHAGEERAVPGINAQHLGNPLKLRRALDAGVRVVVAHCSSMGDDLDLDRGGGGPALSSFALFARMMDEPRGQGRLFGDLSAIVQSKRAPIVLRRIFERTDWHPRLLNGSDYPLPGLMPIFSHLLLVELGLLDEELLPVLNALRRHNALLADLVLKRALRLEGRRLPAVVFETRAFFERRLPAGAAGR